jgi:hypothetical protein
MKNSKKAKDNDELRRKWDIKITEEKERHERYLREQEQLTKKAETREKERTEKKMIPQGPYQIIWIVLDENNEPIGAYKNRTLAIQGCVKFLTKINPDCVTDAIEGSYDLKEPLDWTDVKVIDAMDDFCAEEECRIIETKYY